MRCLCTPCMHVCYTAQRRGRVHVRPAGITAARGMPHPGSVQQTGACLRVHLGAATCTPNSHAPCTKHIIHRNCALPNRYRLLRGVLYVWCKVRVSTDCCVVHYMFSARCVGIPIAACCTCCNAWCAPMVCTPLLNTCRANDLMMVSSNGHTP